MRIRTWIILTQTLCLVTASHTASAQQGAVQDQPAFAAPDDDVPLANAAKVYRLKRADYKPDWRQVGDADDKLGNRLRSHIVRPDHKNVLRGRLVVIEAATGQLNPARPTRIRFLRRGVVAATVTPEKDGSFDVSDLEPGVYGVVAAGAGGFYASSLHVQAAANEETDASAPRRRNIEATAVPPENFKSLKLLMRRHLSKPALVELLAADDLPDGMKEVPPTSAAGGTQLRYHQVELTNDGRLPGRVRRLHPETGRDLKIRHLNVYFIQSGSVVATQKVNPNGTFSVDGLRSGVHSVVCAGPDGFAALSVDVVRPKSTSVSPLPISPVGFGFQTEPLRLDVSVIDVPDLNQGNVNPVTDNFLDEEFIVDNEPEPVFAPFPGAPSGGVLAGGGGAAGTGGGLSGVLLGTAVGVGVASLIDDDNNRRASPSRPN